MAVTQSSAAIQLIVYLLHTITIKIKGKSCKYQDGQN
jgi:hypothetical protein